MSSNEATDTKPPIKPDPGAFKQQGRRRRFWKKNTSGAVTPVARFTSKCDTEGLEGHVYDVGVTNQAELFTSTTKKIVS